VVFKKPPSGGFFAFGGQEQGGEAPPRAKRAVAKDRAPSSAASGKKGGLRAWRRAVYAGSTVTD
jgi:hypothetical protein